MTGPVRTQDLNTADTADQPKESATESLPGTASKNTSKSGASTIINNIIIINNYSNDNAKDSATSLPAAENTEAVYDKSTGCEDADSQADTVSQNLMCRICHSEETSEEYLISPCYCSGTLRFVHQSCLQQWLKSNGIKTCELCKYDFIMSYETRSFKNWEKLDINNIERRKILCSVTFHVIAVTCVIWSLYVLIERTAKEGSSNQFDWSFWTKVVVVAIGFTGGVVFMYIQCKMYIHLCNRWRQYNRVIIIQPITEEILKDSKKKLHESNKIFSAKLTGKNNEKKDRKLNSEVLNEETAVFLTNTNSTPTTATTQQANTNAEAVINLS